MGQTCSTLCYDLIPYEPANIPRSEHRGFFYLFGYYGDRPSDNVAKEFYFDERDPEGLLHELLSFDIVGLIIGSEYIQKSERKLYIFGEDEIDASTIYTGKGGVYAVYPEKYKGHVPFYIGCESLQLGGFQRPRRLDGHNQKANQGRGVDVWKSGGRGWNIVDKKRS
ncbi:uncharacterized protein DFL_006373 [Arthrobotrys flagrans]|uniref:Uncharacterized protein n=1 Tax=Arthrobotrys flagrans TaxID=97331 RepID=A0A437A068_ARTFL|nr:hypothetical protein DFL_006373 [Arthrobotrys flagrans]